MRNPETDRAWREKNAERLKEYNRQYRAAHRDEMNAATKKWADANPDKVKESQAKTYLKRITPSRERIAQACAQEAQTRRNIENLEGTE